MHSTSPVRNFLKTCGPCFILSLPVLRCSFLTAMCLQWSSLIARVIVLTPPKVYCLIGWRRRTVSSAKGSSPNWVIKQSLNFQSNSSDKCQLMAGIIPMLIKTFPHADRSFTNTRYLVNDWSAWVASDFLWGRHGNASLRQPTKKTDVGCYHSGIYSVSADST